MNILPIEGAKKPIFSWCPEIEQGALDQIVLISKMPFVEHCSLMPDAHQGMQMPIGGVVACNGVVVPNFVGVDIGCGMIAVKTSLTKDQFSDEAMKVRLHHSVCRGVPMGFSHNTVVRMNTLKNKLQQKVDYIFEKSKVHDSLKVLPDAEKALWEQLGTLGGGNHFMEISYDESNRVWIVIHSGSRNIGKKVGDYFNQLAKAQNEAWHSLFTPTLPILDVELLAITKYKKILEQMREIPFLPVNTLEGKAYLEWMDFALRFAYLNRAVMMSEVKGSIQHEFPNVEWEPEINIHHNYAAIENHFGKNVWVHRKGATSAKQDETGIIPGSMGTATYITKGLGNNQSLMSCSHGAGRRKGRKAFNIEANTPEMMEAIKKSMEGIVHTKFGKETNKKGKETGMLDVSEAPQAYKDIEDVMANQTDLVKPIHKLLPLINWKDAGEE
jgi:tRNA-splicing ligase RtcB